MRQFILSLCTLLLLVGCTESPIDEIADFRESEFYATIEGTEDTTTKTYVDEQIRMRWTAEDEITMFNKTTYLRQYTFTGKTGANAGGFKKTSVDDEFWYGADVDNVYAVYPYSENITLDETSCVLTLDMPSEQSYAENSFGVGANTMVAVSTSGQLAFKNVGSWLRVRLYGENTSISSVTLTSLGEEAIAGEAEVTATLGGNPTCKMIGTTKSIKLTCATPVQISSSESTPTDFWIVVPPVTFKNGLSVTVKDSQGGTQTYEVNKSFTFERNKYYDFKRGVEIESNTQDINIPYNQIWYYTAGSYPNFQFYKETNYFGTSVVSHTYSVENRKGTIVLGSSPQYIDDFTFAESNIVSIILPNALKRIQMNAFSNCNILTSISIPESVEFIGGFVFENCPKLTSIKLPPKIEEIGRYTFASCTSLTSIIIPEKVKLIGQYAFSGCGNLETVVSNATSPPKLDYRAFYNISTKAVLKVPKGCVSSYRNSTWENYFISIVEQD